MPVCNAAGEKCPKVADNFFITVNKNCPKVTGNFSIINEKNNCFNANKKCLQCKCLLTFQLLSNNMHNFDYYN